MRQTLWAALAALGVLGSAATTQAQEPPAGEKAPPKVQATGEVQGPNLQAPGQPAVPPPPQPAAVGNQDPQDKAQLRGERGQPGAPQEAGEPSLQGGVEFQGGLSPQDIAASGGQNQNPDRWRYRWHNNRWWYWTPANSWVVWQDNGWQPYTPGASRSYGNYGRTYYSQPYRGYGYSNPSYGYGYSRPNYGYRSGPAFNFGYGSPRYYSGYRGGYGSPYGYGRPYGGGRGGVSIGPGGVGFGFRF